MNYVEHILILASTITGSVSICVFALIIGIPVRITSSAVALKIYVITARIKKRKSIIKSKRNNIK